MDYLTQLDVAKRVGVSREAVAFALSINPRLNRKLRPETRQEILKTVHQLGYVPHHAARRLARSRSGSRATSFDQVGMIYFGNPEFSDCAVDPVCLAMMQGAEHKLSEFHASLTFIRVREQQDWTKVERLARAGGVDGWLLCGLVNDTIVNRLNAIGLSLVILGDHRCAELVHCVTVDYMAVGRLAVEHLASLGHRRIAFFVGGSGFVYQEQTLTGFRAARKELGLEEDERLIGDLSSWDQVTLRNWPCAGPIVQWLKKSHPMPTAVFSPELDWAPELRWALEREQWEVPRDISLVACESVFQPRGQDFTRVELPMTEVGRRGALLLHQLVAEPHLKPDEWKLAPSLVVGRSTYPATR